VILFQAPNSAGLGHINRVAAIAIAIRDREPDAMLFVTVQGGGRHSLLDTARLNYVCLPDGPLVYKFGSYTPWGSAVVLKTSREIIYGLGPELIVCDTIPCRPFIAAATEMNVPIALCARKTKNDRGYFELLRDLDGAVDLLLIPHEPDEVEVPARPASRTHCVGNIVRPRAPDHRPTTLHSKQLLVTGGGGGAPRTVHFYNLAMEAFARRRREDPYLDCVIVPGPLFSQWWDLRIVEGVRVIPSVPEIRDLIAGSDLVICQAGYNTISEIKQFNVPCICIPAMRGFDDQFARALAAAKSSSQFHVYQNNDPADLSELIGTCLSVTRPAAEESRPSSSGADRAAG